MKRTLIHEFETYAREPVIRRLPDGSLLCLFLTGGPTEPDNQNITAEDCSKIACMSYSYFSRSFRAVTGKNFKEYLNQVRVAHAEKALLTSDKSVTEVAAHCGYDNVSYFISVYKRIKGVTPHVTAGRKRAFKEAGESKA